MKFNIKSDCRGLDAYNTVAQIFRDRGIDDPDHFLHPTADDMLPLTDLKGVEIAWPIVKNAIDNNKKIGILFDSDSDGVTSGAIMHRYLERFGANLEDFINHGKSHGLQSDDLEKYKSCYVLIIVDSLDSTIDNYRDVQINSDITDVIVLDHHAINPDIPYDDYVTLVSSQRDYGNPQLSGAGVVWKFCAYVDSVEGTDYANDYIDLCAVGLQADMMNMIVPENRYIMNEGLSEVHNLALKKMVGGFGFDSKAIAFSVAPLINSSNRMDKNEDAMKAFLSDDNLEVLSHMRVLKKCKEQQNIEIDAMMPDIQRQIDKQLDKKIIIIKIETENGLSGLIGNRILSVYKRPIIIVKDCGDVYAGSMRAVGVDDFRQMINDSGLASAFGHENASGVEIPKKNLKAFLDYMYDTLPEVGAFEETMDVDIQVNANDIDRYYVDEIQRLNKISGTGFQPIRFYADGITGFHVTDMSNGKHLVIELPDTELKLIQWNFNGDWEVFEDAELFDEELEVVFQVQNGFLGRNFWVQGIIDYVGVKE